ncbi:putative gpi anchored protein [Botrytis fragariae]|uniref:Putative gpi anchored protein n=1 Tax=Botrytis fragariae TaxID=1964551 RepID=A0A8H6EDR4_9HELO|nr:putative gpi anchored protein [Botrytis fragariae]KAF5868383.1 putative gpi anchored protein [Botrytis fragariae]
MVSLWMLGTCARNIERDGNSDGLQERGDEIQLFVHSGALHTAKHLETEKLAQTIWVSTPQEILVRESNNLYTENYAHAYRDVHLVYQLSLRWILSGNSSCVDAATAATLNGWSTNLIGIWGNKDIFLAAGLYGYQFANSGELL